jgi:hypothetical protein
MIQLTSAKELGDVPSRGDNWIILGGRWITWYNRREAKLVVELL